MAENLPIRVEDPPISTFPSIGDSPPKFQSVSSLSDYQLLSQIGKGAFSIVKKARDKRTGRIVSIKFIDKTKYPQSLPILNENNILTTLSAEGCSKHILCFLESFEDDDIYYIITEYIEGKSLNKYVIQTSLTEKDEINLMVQIAEAIMVLHNAGIAHRDLKPDNILVYEELVHKKGKSTPYKVAKIKLIDFGLSCNIYRGSDSPCTSKLIGTPRYLSPEQLNHTVTDPRTTDIFALASIFYYIATQQYLFNSSNIKTILQDIKDGNHNKLGSINDELAELIKRMMLPTINRPKIAEIVEKIWKLE